MSNSFLLQAIGVLSLVLLATSALVYTRVIRRIRREGGQVRSAGFGLSEALAALVLGGYFCLVIGQSLLAKKEGPSSPEVEQTASDSIITTQLIPNSVFFIVLAAGIAFYLKFARGMSLRETFGFNRVPPLKILGWAAGLVLCAFPLVNLAALLSQAALRTLQHEDSTPQPLVQLFRGFAHQGNYHAVAAILIAAGVIAPVCEEFLFRGLFYGVGKRFLTPAPAAILTAALFAAFHLNLASLASLFVLAICLTLAYERTGSLFVPIGMHAIFNFSNLLVIFGQAQGWFPAQ